RGSSASTPTRSPPIMIAEPETTRPSNGSGVIGVAMHGKTLALKTEHAPIAAYAREHRGRLAVLPAARPDLEVVAHWSEGDSGTAPWGDGAGLDVIGKRMCGDPDELLWLDPLLMKGLELRFRRLGERWGFDVHYTY